MGSYNRTSIKKDYSGIRSLLETTSTPFGKCTAAQKKKRKEKGLNHIKHFALTYFPHHLADKMSVMHETLYARYEEIVSKAEVSGWGSKEVHAAPRQVALIRDRVGVDVFARAVGHVVGHTAAPESARDSG